MRLYRYFASTITIGIPFEDSFPDGSYLVSHFESVEDDFADLPGNGSVVLDSDTAELTSVEGRALVETLTAAFEASPDVYTLDR